MLIYSVSNLNSNISNESKPLSKFEVFKQKVSPTLTPIIKSLRKISESYSDSDSKLSESDDVNKVNNYDN